MVETALTRDAGIDLPLICGAMYPCSNPELVAAAKKANAQGGGFNDYWQAGKSVAGVERVLSVREVVDSYREAVS